MLRSPTILRILLAFALHSAAIAGCFCAVAQAGCGDYLHTKMGPPPGISTALPALQLLQLDAAPAVNHLRLNRSDAQNVHSGTRFAQPAPGPARPQPCTGWQCRQQKTPWLPLPRSAVQAAASVDAMLASGLRCPANSRDTSPLWILQPLPARSAPNSPIDYPPKISTLPG